MQRVSRFFVQKFLSHSAEKLRRGTLLCFRKFLVSKNVRDKRGGGNHDLPSKLFSSHSTQTFSRGTLLCFRKFRLSKNFMPKIEISPFSIENFLSHSTEKLGRGALLCFTNFLVSKKIWIRGEGGGREYHDFLPKIFCPKVPKFFVGESFSVSLISGIENFMDKMGNIKIFRRKVLVSAEKFRRGTLPCFRKFLVSKNIGDQS